MIRWLATFLLIWFVFTVRHVFPPFIVGAIFAYLLLPVIHQVASWAKIKKSLAAGLVYLTMVITTVIVCWIFLPMIIDQFEQLFAQKEEIISKLVSQAAVAFSWNLDVNQTTANILGSIKENVGRPTEIVHIGGILSEGLLAVLVCLVSSIYFTVDSERVAAFCLRFVPENRRATVANLSGQMNRMLSRYVRGQLLLVMLMTSVARLFLQYFVHMKHAIPVAILSGFLEIIPVLGPILATTIATLVGFAQSGGPTALTIIVFYTLARWVEDYVIVPRIIGHAVELHPLVVIFAVLCGERLAGALGMLIAIPVAASFKVILDFTYPQTQAIELPVVPAPDSPELEKAMEVMDEAQGHEKHNGV